MGRPRASGAVAVAVAVALSAENMNYVRLAYWCDRRAGNNRRRLSVWRRHSHSKATGALCIHVSQYHRRAMVAAGGVDNDSSWDLVVFCKVKRAAPQQNE